MLVDFGHVSGERGQIWPGAGHTLASPVEVGEDLVKVRPEVGQAWPVPSPKLGDFGGHLTKAGQVVAKLGRFCPKPAPISARHGSSICCRFRSMFYQRWPGRGHHWANLSSVVPILAKFGTDSVKVWRF